MTRSSPPATREKIRVLIAEHSVQSQERMRQVLNTALDIDVAGSAFNTDESIQMVAELQPGVVLMRIDLSGAGGIRATQEITRQWKKTQVVIIADKEGPDDVRNAMKAGARDFLVEPFSDSELINMIRQVHGLIDGGHVTASIAFVPPMDNASPLREWWHQILRYYNRYHSYAMLFALPSDREAIRYLKEFGGELHLITGNACLVITLTGSGFMQYGGVDGVRALAVDEYIAEGYCIQAAELFKINFDKFPCLVLFRDIRSPEHILVTLKGLSTEEIAQELRSLFSIVNEAVKEDKDPIATVDKYNKQQAFSEKKKAAWAHVQSFAGKTFEKVMEVLVEIPFKQ